eukprot:m.255671 g.255671  ORF g.255671 m.255671 type:complete len:300 (+) comp15503_c0_seq1:61-960(+)
MAYQLFQEAIAEMRKHHLESAIDLFDKAIAEQDAYLTTAADRSDTDNVALEANNELIISCHSGKARCYAALHHLESAFQEYKLAYELCLDTYRDPADPRRLRRTIHFANSLVSCSQAPNLSEALALYLDVEKHLVAGDETINLAALLNNIAAVYLRLGQRDKSIEYHERAVEATEQGDDDVARVQIRDNYQSMMAHGADRIDLGVLEMEHINQSLLLGRDAQPVTQIKMCCCHVGAPYFQETQKMVEEARALVEEMKESFQKGELTFSTSEFESHIEKLRTFEDFIVECPQHLYMAAEE